VFCELLGAAVATAIIGDENYLAAYSDSGIGGLLSTVLRPALGRFGDFCNVVLALSIVASTCPVVYSVSFSLQALSQASQRVPRFLWTAVGGCVCVAIAIPAYDGFGSWLENLVLVTGYWTSLYLGILVPEHFVFRRNFSAYHMEDYAIPGAHPPGVAAAAAFTIGIIGVALGMSQSWYTGPVSKLCGDPGGDVGFELGLGFTIISYVVLRPLEKRYFGR
jgi:purine-cytosine permease-like protein